ncbi:aldehyde ferredoxin oxidoreductase C-terminal domain-containing protein [Halobellus marinus]|uniref:aldehyde ferredoxin oxidoreductase C-terminal domain-containing protein n=1 Tax=Halobellus TaxID=1073986 RepID=UPI0028ACC29E|nr:aldehyde ferredoxin oxidoreductase C-terminal domain-containing protein [Halobellus sp. DFY28]
MRYSKGPMLTIDVSEREVREQSIDEELSSFIGGRGVATRLAHQRIPFDADPYGPENRLFFATGPLQMSQMSFTGRMNVTGLSPMTDGLASSNAGGYLSRNFADTGYSVVEIVGESDELLAVHVSDDRIEFEHVPELDEALVPEVTKYMATEHDLESENLVTVGPAGDNLVRFASLMTYDSRAFGRGGFGAALGAKNVKCITFQGDSRPSLDLSKEAVTTVHRDAATSDDLMKRQGTAGSTAFINDNFSLPTRYFEETTFEGASGIGGDAVEEKKYKKGSCSVCAFGCKLPTRDEESGVETEGPEFETIYAFGSSCAIDDIVSVMKSNQKCDLYGMDTVSAGVTVAAYLKSQDDFGNSDLIHKTLDKIAFRDGIGDQLAEGVARCHETLGVQNWTVKGLEFAGHDGRVLHGQGLSYAVANRGADHMYSVTLGQEYDGVLPPKDLSDEKVKLVVDQENRMALRDSGIFCNFAEDYITDDQKEQLLDADIETLLDVGASIVELERHFNNRRGKDRSDDILPYDLPGFESALDSYYEVRGWDNDGTVPGKSISQYNKN